MPFTIETYDPNHLEGLLALYHAETAFTPHVAPLTPDLFVELVARKPRFDPTGLLVARAGGEVVGWIHACVAPGSEPWHDPARLVARIRMLLYPATRLYLGRALVSAATAWLREQTSDPLEAMDADSGYPFYRGLWFGSEPMGAASLPHVQLALEVGGYKLAHESIFMTASFDTAPPAFPPGLDLAFATSPAEMLSDGMRDSWVGFTPMRTRALLNGEEVGHLGWVVLPHVAEKLGAPCLSIYSLGVREEHRRKGIAAALVSRSLAQGHAQGARFASVGTQLWNSPAQATYAKFGFRPHSLLLGRRRED